MKRIRPLCACGCLRRVKHGRCRYATPQCVPLAVRQAAGRAARRAYAYKNRRRLFAAELEQLQGKVITREDLLELIQRAYLKGRAARRQELARERKAAA